MTPEAEQLPRGMWEAQRAARFLSLRAPIAAGRVHPNTRNAFLRGLSLEEIGQYGPDLAGALRIYGVPVNPDPSVDPGVLVVETEPYVTRVDAILPDRLAGRMTVEDVHTTRIAVHL